jgi:putative endonuclease
MYLHYKTIPAVQWMTIFTVIYAGNHRKYAGIKMTTRKSGKHGEAVAIAALQQAGYTIVDRNWRCIIGEIDVVARHGNDLVFIEVRSRADGSDTALESIGVRKQQKLMKLAQAYLNEHQLDDTAFRIDVVAVGAGKAEIIESAVGW